MPLSQYSTNADRITSFNDLSRYITIEGVGEAQNALSSISVKQKPGIDPQLYFTYVKKKFSILERMRMDRRMKSLEKAFNVAIKNGQSALGEKLLLEVVKSTKESAMFAKGIKFFIEHEDIKKYKNKIRDGHISDTQLKDFTRVIPKNVLKEKSKVEECFDGFVIYHYWNDNQKDVKKMDEEEKRKMKDPILFGWINESDRLYFIADWEDEYCTLTFDEIVDVIGKDESEITIPRKVDEL